MRGAGRRLQEEPAATARRPRCPGRPRGRPAVRSSTSIVSRLPDRGSLRWRRGSRAPSIGGLGIKGFSDPRSVYLEPGRSYRAAVEAEDPDSDPLAYAWDVRPEVEIPPESYAGSLERKARPIEGLIRDPARREVELCAPESPGAYRLFVTVEDGKGRVAYGNVPFCVSGEERGR